MRTKYNTIQCRFIDQFLNSLKWIMRKIIPTSNFVVRNLGSQNVSQILKNNDELQTTKKSKVSYLATLYFGAPVKAHDQFETGHD